MREDTVVIICIFAIIVVLHSNMFSSCTDGYTGRNPLARHLSLPDNVSEPNILPAIPYYRTPNETNTITNYIYNASDGSVPTVYAYNQYMTSYEPEGMSSHDIFGPYGGTFANAQSEGMQGCAKVPGIIPILNKVPGIIPRPNKTLLNLNTLDFTNTNTKVRPSKKNPLYLPQVGTPIEPGWKY